MEYHQLHESIDRWFWYNATIYMVASHWLSITYMMSSLITGCRIPPHTWSINYTMSPDT